MLQHLYQFQFRGAPDKKYDNYCFQRTHVCDDTLVDVSEALR
jgi:hypothetical protein